MIAEKSAAPCSKCKREILRTPDEWRLLIERDELPVCDRCNNPKKPLSLSPNPNTACNQILIAIARLATEHRNYNPTKGDIAIEAWRSNSVRFGIPNNLQHPDTNRVIMELVKMRSRDATIESAGESRYRLTDKGRRIVARMEGR